MCFAVKMNTRILNDGFVTRIRGPAEEMEELADYFEKDVPHLCDWLERARSLETGRFAKGYVHRRP